MFHSLQIHDLGTNVVEPIVCDFADGLAIGAVFEPQEGADFLKGEAEFMGAFNEAYAIYQFKRIHAKGAVTRIRCWQQCKALIIAHRFDTDIRCARAGRSSILRH